MEIKKDLMERIIKEGDILSNEFTDTFYVVENIDGKLYMTGDIECNVTKHSICIDDVDTAEYSIVINKESSAYYDEIYNIFNLEAQLFDINSKIKDKEKEIEEVNAKYNQEHEFWYDEKELTEEQGKRAGAIFYASVEYTKNKIMNDYKELYNQKHILEDRINSLKVYANKLKLYAD